MHSLPKQKMEGFRQNLSPLSEKKTISSLKYKDENVYHSLFASHLQKDHF